MEIKILLTGAGHRADIVKGIEHHDELNQHDNRNPHINVLKVQHHKSEQNIDSELCRKVAADHYIFFGNGEHKNPDFDVVEGILNFMLGGATNKNLNREVDQPLKLLVQQRRNRNEKSKSERTYSMNLPSGR